MKEKTVIKIRNYIIIVCIIYIVIIAVSFLHSFYMISQKYEKLAVITGRTFFEGQLVARKWNSLHNGVYVPVNEKIQPNPYLNDSLRDISTKEKLEFTKINPSHMTRLISELLQDNKHVSFHLTALNPKRPGNKSDEWERKALLEFERGKSEIYEAVKVADSTVFRYMAPVFIEKSCLVGCHFDEKYKIGQVGGGISVTIPFSPFQEAADSNIRLMILAHIFFIVTGLTIIFLLGRKLIKSISDLYRASQHIARLEGFLPICSNCKKIRISDEKEASWQQVENYIKDHSDADFTHTICPECRQKLYPNIGKK